MKISTLLSQRQTILRHARLANAAFAYQTLSEFAARLQRARLAGPLSLKSASPDEGRFCATLTPLQGSQAVVEEHFTEEDLMEIADVVAFATSSPASGACDLTFCAADIPEMLAPLRAELEKAGVATEETQAATHDTTTDQQLRTQE